MASWFNQTCLQDENEWQTVGVFCSQNFIESYSANIKHKKSIYRKACLAPLDGLVVNWVDCMPSKPPFYGGSKRKPYALMKERITRKKELKFIRDTMCKNNISLKHIKEIWYGNGIFNQHFFYLCSGTVGFQFEHGFPEIISELNYQVKGILTEEVKHFDYQYLKLLKQAKKWLVKQIVKRWIYFTPDIIQRNVCLSILTDEIIRAKPENTRVNNIQIQEVISITQSVIKYDPSYPYFKELKGNTAIILLMHLRPKPWGKKEEDELLTYFESFESFLISHMKKTFQKFKIKNLIFKSRFFHEEYSEEGFNRFSKLSKQYNLIFQSSYSETNYPIEFYIPLIKPTLLIGLLSSGLFYSKKILPDITTYTYDSWYNDFTKNHLQGIHPELAPLRELFFNSYGDSFKDILPKDVDYVSSPISNISQGFGTIATT